MIFMAWIGFLMGVRSMPSEPGYLVIAAEDMSVPARALAMIDVDVRDTAVCHLVEMSGDLLVERRDKFKVRTSLRVGRMLIDASQIIPVIEIMNTSDIPVFVGKGTVIGIGEIVRDFINFGLEISKVIDNEQLATNQARDDNDTEDPVHQIYMQDPHSQVPSVARHAVSHKLCYDIILVRQR